jgi:hypothetical protein
VLALLLLPNKPPPVLLVFALPKMLPPVFVFEPKPEDAEGKLDIFEVHGAALINWCAVSPVPLGRAEHVEKEKCAYLHCYWRYCCWSQIRRTSTGCCWSWSRSPQTRPTRTT